MIRATGFRARVRTILALLIVTIAPIFSANSVNALAATKTSRSSVPSGGDFYQDIPEAATAPLGAAQYFHIFANETELDAHVNGNIATGLFSGNVNFGTNIIQGYVEQDLMYLQRINKIQNSSFVDSTGSDTRLNKVVVGQEVPVALTGTSDQQSVYLADQKMDHLTSGEVFQDPAATETYINIKQELAKDQQQGLTWAQKADSKNVSYNNSDENNRELAISDEDDDEDAAYSVILTKVDEQGQPLANATFSVYEEGKPEPLRTNLTTNKNGQLTLTDLPSIGDYYFVETKAPTGYRLDAVKRYFKVSVASQTSKSDYVYYHLDKSELERDRPLKISGLSADGPAIIINVDLQGASTLNLQSKIVPIIDDSDRHNQETEDFSDAKILFNFYNGATPATEISVNQPFTGTMLAPTANITAHQNVDGSMIGNKVHVQSGETHRWDFQSNFQTGDGIPVELKVANSKENTVATTKIAGTKHWLDGDNADGQRPAKIIVDLYQNGEQIDYREISAATNWQYSFNNLPEFDELGNKYQYTVKEWSVPGYLTTVAGADVTNTLTTSLHGRKTWVDNNNALGARPASVQVDLYQNGVGIGSQTLTAANQWQYNFNNLPKYDPQDKLYDYQVREVAVPGYTSSQNGTDFTNTIVAPRTTSVTGHKTWVDDNNAAQTRPEQLTVHLYQNGQLYRSQTVTAANNWQYHFAELPVVDTEGADYEYTIGEDAVPGYDSSRDGDDLTNTLVDNEVQAATTELSGTKQWVGDESGQRPTSVTIGLQQNGTQIKTQTISAADQWQYHFTDLPKKDAAGKDYVYTVKEIDPPADYSSEQVGNDFINTYLPTEKTSVDGTKIWQDNDNAEQTRPATVTIALYQNEHQLQTTTTSAAQQWQYQFKNLPKYDSQGQEYAYTVKEVQVPGNYTSTVVAGNVVNTLRKTSLSGTKKWVDHNNAAGLRPTGVTINLLRDGTKIASQTVTAATNWQYQFTDLTAIDPQGVAYQYTVTEEPVPGYSSSQTGTDFTNTLRPTTTPQPSMTEVAGRKLWQDHDNASGQRPRQVTINLYRDGVKVAAQTISAADHWQYQFTHLAKTDDKGHEYQYTVKESPVAGYHSQQVGHDFVNTLIEAEKPVEPAKPITPTKPSQPITVTQQRATVAKQKLPQANETTTTLPLLVGFIILLSVTMVVLVRKVRHD